MNVYIGIVLAVAGGWALLALAFLWLWCASHPTRGRHTARARRVPYMPPAEVDVRFFEIAGHLTASVEEER